MRIEFDAAKDASNHAKHGVSLALAKRLDWDSMLVRPDDRREYGELRFIGVTVAPIGPRLYVIVYTQRGEAIRVITCAKRTTERWPCMKKRTKVIKPTAAEDRAIKAGVRRDPDTRELSAEDFAQMRPFRRGRPASAVHKVPVTVRLDPGVVEFFREGGPGWQTRMNDALSKYVTRQRRGA